MGALSPTRRSKETFTTVDDPFTSRETMDQTTTHEKPSMDCEEYFKTVEKQLGVSGHWRENPLFTDATCFDQTTRQDSVERPIRMILEWKLLRKTLTSDVDTYRNNGYLSLERTRRSLPSLSSKDHQDHWMHSHHILWRSKEGQTPKKPCTSPPTCHQQVHSQGITVTKPLL